MLSLELAKILEAENYKFSQTQSLITFNRPSALITLWKIMSAVLIIALPLLSIYTNITLVTIASFVLFAALYKLLTDTEVPLEVEINLAAKTIRLKSATGIKSELVRFDDIANLRVSSFEEFQDANAFKDSVSKMQYFIDIESKHYKHSIIKFTKTAPKTVHQIKDDFKAMFGILEPVKAS
ncbi:hypothetical protein [Fulvivirga sp.]|uniref:hypothetical protein n=1 Tax=Fulvivirga sp. TaxID=1931237 RepID=UPI0032EFC8B2